MLFEYLFNRKRECLHSKIPLDVDCAYCPDCGELVENRWFILRCSCCGARVPATIYNGKIVAVNKHCTNCGCNDFLVEELEKVNFINVGYAVVLKKAVHQDEIKFTQSWVEIVKEQTSYGKLGLLR